MQKLLLHSTIKSPSVNFNADTGNLLLVGKSIPENSYELYAPLLEWVDSYIDNPADETKFVFKLSYFNSSSTEYILDIMKKLDQLHKEGKSVKVEWYYSEEDEDMEQVGEDFKMMLALPIDMIATTESDMYDAGF